MQLADIMQDRGVSDLLSLGVFHAKLERQRLRVRLNPPDVPAGVEILCLGSFREHVDRVHIRRVQLRCAIADAPFQPLVVILQIHAEQHSIARSAR